MARKIINDYYEAVFRQMVAEKSLSFQAIFFDHKPWYEIDTIEDLAFAEKLFPTRPRLPLFVYDIEPDRLEDTDLYPHKSFGEESLYARY